MNEIQELNNVVGALEEENMRLRGSCQELGELIKMQEIRHKQELSESYEKYSQL